jgi:hypothetical protein
MRSQSPLDVTALVLLLAVPVALFGQVPYDACRDRTGGVIKAQIAPDEVGRFAAMATWKEGQRVILWRPSAFNGLSDVARVFVYLHECAHHTLHHVDHIALSLDESARQEQEADCWAIQTMVEGEMIGTRGLETIREEWKNSEGDVIHQSGEVLLRSLEACLRAKTDRKRWRSVLDSLLAGSRTGFESIAGPLVADGGPDAPRESTLDLPSTFDCEIRQRRSFVCIVFVSRTAKPAERRFNELAKILDEWKPVGWTVTERIEPETEQPRQHLLTEETTGGTIALVLHRLNRVYFIYRPPVGR